jgi:hypothetical protein
MILLLGINMKLETFGVALLRLSSDGASVLCLYTNV